MNDTPTFAVANGTGSATAAFFGGADWAFANTVQPDGKIIVAGGGDYAIVRLNANGSPDTSFSAASAAATARSNT